MSFLVRFENAFLEWRVLLGGKGAQKSSDVTNAFTQNCIGLQRNVYAVLTPTKRDQVQKIVQIASKHKVSLYSFSTGNNWGYGSAAPVGENCVLVDLSRMNKVLSFDVDAGVVTIEPGVTQRILDAYLKKHDFPYLIPVTGAGPDCSLMGNALERGYGITPYTDHFAAVMGLEAVLPDGEIYSSMMNGLGGRADKLYKWGIGPYVDGLFSQSNLGIVIQMSIALAPAPERIEAFFFSVEESDDLELAAEKIHQVIRQVGGVMGSINLMNKHRMLSMVEPYPQDGLNDSGVISESRLLEMMKRNQIMEWTSVGAIYGNKRVVVAVRREIRKILRVIAKRLVFFTPQKAAVLSRLAQKTPKLRTSNFASMLSTLNKSMQLIAGGPSEVALPLAYWRSGFRPKNGVAMNPAKDGCGLIWYAPLVPMKTHLVRKYVDMVERICIKHNIEPLITLTSLSDRCWDSTVPILFDRLNADEVLRAQECYQELLETGCKYGFVPYRLGAQSMAFLGENNAVPPILTVIKKALDPDRILSPGRYGL